VVDRLPPGARRWAVKLTVGELKRVLQALEEGEPRMTDGTPVRVDFLNDDNTVMGPIAGAVIEDAYWSIDEETLSLLVRTEKRVEL
jgi:hypothetical protein